uniref:Abhydrolase domain containing 6b n=1 Tax=Sinocyclocheilus grahami TaxID=75366 RepID=A0A672MRL6_SINGR
MLPDPPPSLTLFHSDLYIWSLIAGQQRYLEVLLIACVIYASHFSISACNCVLCYSAGCLLDKNRVAIDQGMVNMFVIAAGTLAIPLLLFMASFMLWPSSLIKVYYWYWRRTLGLQVRYADCRGYRFCYSYRGKPGLRPSVLMLHDFSAHKDTWLPMVKYLPKHLHLLCVDMPGHEGTTRTNTDDYSIQGQVKRIRQAIRLNRKPFHLVGTSMCGTVAGVYAACHPSDLCSLTLICLTGLRNQNESKFDSQMHEVEHSQYTLNIPLIPSTPEEMEEMLKLCSHVRFRVPQQISHTNVM